MIRRVFWFGTFLNLLCLSGSSMFVVFPRYLADSGLAPWEIGLVEGMGWVGAVISQPWLAHRLDRHGRRPYFFYGALSMALCALAYLAVPPLLGPMALLRGLHGFAVAAYFTAMFTWVADQAPAGQTARVFGYYGISGLIAGAVGPVVGEWCADGPGFRTLFWIAAGFSGVAALLMSLLKEIQRDPVDHVPEGFWKLSRARILWSVTAGCLGFGYAVGTLFAFAAPYLAKNGIPGTGVLFFCYTLSSVLVRLGVGGMTDRVGSHRVIPISLLVQATGLAILAALGKDWRSMPVVIATGLVAGAGHGILYPALSSLAVNRLGPAVKGTALALITAYIDFGSALGATLSGVIADYHGYPVMFLVVGLLIVATAMGFPALDARSSSS